MNEWDKVINQFILNEITKDVVPKQLRDLLLIAKFEEYKRKKNKDKHEKNKKDK